LLPIANASRCGSARSSTSSSVSGYTIRPKSLDLVRSMAKPAAWRQAN